MNNKLFAVFNGKWTLFGINLKKIIKSLKK